MTNEERDTIIMNTHDTVVRMDERMSAHIDNMVIHQVPPCKSHETLSARIWGLFVLVFGSMMASLLAYFK